MSEDGEPTSTGDGDIVDINEKYHNKYLFSMILNNHDIFQQIILSIYM